MAEEDEVKYASVVFKNKKNPWHEDKKEEEIVYAEVKVRGETPEQTGDTNAGILPNKKANKEHRHNLQLACCLGILCVTLLLGVIAVCVYFTTFSHDSEQKQLKENIASLLAANHNLTNLNHKLRSENEKLRQDQTNLTVQVGNLTQDYRVLESKITNLTEENKDLKTQNQNLTTQNQQLETQNQDLETQNQNYRVLESKITNLTEENKDLKTQNQNLTTQNQQLETQNQDLETQNQNYRVLESKITNLTEENKDLKTQNQNLTTQNQQLETQNQDLETQNQNYRVLESKITNLTEENKDLKTQNQNLTTQNQQLETQNKDLERQKNNVNVSRAQWSIDAYCRKENGVRWCKPCQDGWSHSESSCYAINNALSYRWKTWDEAREDCKGKISDLAVIVNPEEKKYTTNKSWGSSGTTGYWIGLRAEDGKWKWADGTDLTETSWMEDPPDDGHCAISVQNEGWKSVKCGDRKMWICGKKAVSV